MKNLNEALIKIKENPSKYIGEKSIGKLHQFINGYVISQCNEAGECPEGLMGLREFIEQKYDIRSAVSWSKIICLYSASDEQAFEKFFSILDEFHEQEGR